MEEKIKNILLEKSIEFIVELINKKGGEKLKLEVDYEKVFLEYLNKKFTKLSLFSSIVLKNKQTFLNDIYIPLTLTGKQRDYKFKIEKYPEELVNEFGLILITDTAGMGKSTIMKKIFLSAVIEKKGIPIFVELRRINENENIITEIQKELSLTNYQVNDRILQYLFEQGDFIFFFDGFDEISSENKANVTKELQKFVTKNLKNNKFFLASRPDVALSSFNEFKEFEISKLELEESFELIRKYDKTSTVSELLIQKLNEKEMKPIHEFLVNPLLTSLLFLAFEHKQKIPLKKHLFYRQVYDANFENHDLTKGDSYTRKKLCQLQSDDFHRVLRHIGYQCLKLQKIEFEKDMILSLITKSQEYNNDLDFKATDFLNDLILTVPLFTKDGNYYKWSHRSIQEYFAAQFIFKDSKDQQTKILERIYSHEDIDYFMNTVELYYDIDYKTFREIIEFNLLNDFKSYFSKMMNVYDKSIDIEQYKRRIELTFLKEIYLVQDGRPEINNLDYHKWELENNEKIELTKEEQKLIESLELSRPLMSQLFSKRKDTKESIQNGKFKYLSHGVRTFPRHGLSTYFIINDSKKLLLLNLLYRKGKKYIKHFERGREFFVIISLDKKNQNKVIKLNFNKENPYNIDENFNLTNELIATDFPFTIDSNQIDSELELIRNDRTRNKEELFEF